MLAAPGVTEAFASSLPSPSGWLPYPSPAASREGFKGLEKYVVQDQMLGFSEICSSFSPLCSVTLDHGEIEWLQRKQRLQRSQIITQAADLS